MAARWVLVRQDTHGTRFDVASFTSEIDARAAMAEYESGYPHHQTYFVVDRPERAIADLDGGTR